MNLLDTPIADVHDNRPLLDRVLRTVALDAGISYADAYDKLVQGGIDSRATTLRRALQGAGIGTEGLEEGVKLLDAAESQATAVYDAAKPKRLQTDSFGRILLDQDYDQRPESVGADGQLMDPREFEDRLKRARKLSARYGGDEGRKMFESDDQMHLRAGVDIVRSAELAAEDQMARAHAGRVAIELDQGITATAGKAGELRQLDGQIDELQERRDKLNERPVVADGTLRMLEQSQLDQALGGLDKKTANRVRKRMRRLDIEAGDRPGLLRCLEAEIRDDPMPPKPEPAAPTTPPGTYPGSHELNGRIRKYMLDNELPDSQYGDVVDQVFAGRLAL